MSLQKFKMSSQDVRIHVGSTVSSISSISTAKDLPERSRNTNSTVTASDIAADSVGYLGNDSHDNVNFSVDNGLDAGNQNTGTPINVDPFGGKFSACTPTNYGKSYVNAHPRLNQSDPEIGSPGRRFLSTLTRVTRGM